MAALRLAMAPGECFKRVQYFGERRPQVGHMRR
jgi:hypothetical protein